MLYKYSQSGLGALRRQTYLRGLPAASALRAQWLASLAVARFAR